MENLLKAAKEKYPRNTLFYSASGALKSPMKVHSLKESEVTKGSIYDSEGGVIYDSLNKTWAKLC